MKASFTRWHAVRYSSGVQILVQQKPNLLVMKNSFTKLLSVAATALAFSGAAQAATISGTINFGGGFTPAAVPFDTSVNNVITIINNQLVGVGQTGAFVGIATGTPVSMLGTAAPAGAANSGTFITNVGSAASTVVTPSSSTLWSVGGFTFTLGTVVETFSDATSINLRATGIISNGPDSSPGIWLATFNSLSGANVSSTFSASNVALPDGGSTALIMGATLLGMFFVRRRFA